MIIFIKTQNIRIPAKINGHCSFLTKKPHYLRHPIKANQLKLRDNVRNV